MHGGCFYLVDSGTLLVCVSLYNLHNIDNSLDFFVFLFIPPLLKPC